MNNLIIKKDIKSNWLVYLLSSIAIILLTLVLSRGYLIVGFNETILIFISVLAGILLGLLSLSLLVYVLINNFYSDKHKELLPKVKSQRKYLYYRIIYAYLSLIYFIAVGVITAIIVTDLTWYMVLEFINVTTFVILLNAFLVYFCFFMASYYKTVYNFKLPLRVLIGTALLILSLLITLFLAIGASIVEVIIASSISVALGIVLISLNVSVKQKYKITNIVFDAILIIIVLLIGIVFASLQTYMNDPYYSDDPYYSEGDGYYEGEKGGEETYSSVNKIVYENSNELGNIVVFLEESNSYSMYIDGEYKTEVYYSAYSEETNYESTSINYQTGENVSFSYYSGLEGAGADIYTTSVEDEQRTYCNAYIPSEVTDLEAELDSIECLKDEQKELIIAIDEEIKKSLEVINN